MTIAATNMQRGPVVDLADDQAAANVEADVERRRVGVGHGDAVERHVAAVVDGLAHRRIEEERQVGAGEQQDDERVERDLAHHERPVVGEDLVQLSAQRAGDTQALVDELAGLALGSLGLAATAGRLGARTHRGLRPGQ